MPRKSAASAVASLKRSAMKPDDDLPEVTDAMLADAELRVGERVIRRGRPPSAAPKEAIKLQSILTCLRIIAPKAPAGRRASTRRCAGPPSAAQPSNAQAKGRRGALARQHCCGPDRLPRGSPCRQRRTPHEAIYCTLTVMRVTRSGRNGGRLPPWHQRTSDPWPAGALDDGLRTMSQSNLPCSL